MRHYITWFEISALLASLIALPRLWARPHGRIFPLVLLLIVGVEFHQTYFRDPSAPNNALIYNVMLLIQNLLYLGMLYWYLEGKAARRFILGAMVVLVIATAVSSPTYFAEHRFNVVAYAIGAILLVVGILLKFYELLKSPTGFNFLRNPYFFILFALLLFNLGTLPNFTMGNWLYYEMGRPDLVVVLGQVVSVLNFLLYGTYTVCFLWIRATKVSY